MYLIHNTTVENLTQIVSDCQFKSNKLTGKINVGDGIYKEHPNNNIYFLYHANII